MDKKSALFHAMTGRWAWLFMLILPAVWIVFLSLGWTQDDYVEDSVYNIWSRSGGDYYQDKEYAEDVLGEDNLVTSSFLAMAKTRDGNDNLFTAERLEEVRARMEKAERATVSNKRLVCEMEETCQLKQAIDQLFQHFVFLIIYIG